MFKNESIFEKSETAQYICFLYKDFQSYCEERLKKHDLTNGLYYYLIFIYKRPGSILNEINKFMNVDKSHTTRAIQKLIASGYVEKKVNEDDKKSFRVYPTEKCNEIMHEMKELFPEYEKGLLKDFSNDESEMFKSLLKKAGRNIIKKGE